MIIPYPVTRFEPALRPRNWVPLKKRRYNAINLPQRDLYTRKRGIFRFVRVYKA